VQGVVGGDGGITASQGSAAEPIHHLRRLRRQGEGLLTPIPLAKDAAERVIGVEAAAFSANQGDAEGGELEEAAEFIFTLQQLSLGLHQGSDILAGADHPQGAAIGRDLGDQPGLDVAHFPSLQQQAISEFERLEKLRLALMHGIHCRAILGMHPLQEGGIAGGHLGRVETGDAADLIRPVDRTAAEV
jgi:hypothetical protein